jgi:predicted peptidase
MKLLNSIASGGGGYMNQQNFTLATGYNHIIFFPFNYLDRGEAWPAIFFLHGAGERGNDLKLVMNQGLPHILKDREDFPFIAIAPQCPDGQYWIPSMVEELVAMSADQFRIDLDRVYLTGISLGGYGTWRTAVEYPNRFAAIAPICGGGDPDKAFAIRDLPVWAFHGAKDTVINISESEEMVNSIKKIGGDVKFTIYPEGVHDIWSETYDNPLLYEWFLSHKRKE